MTQETYQHLVEAHGINRELCRHCLTRDIEVWQCEWEGCYSCWCKECEPTITYPDDD